jgi:hypothetical protein
MSKMRLPPVSVGRRQISSESQCGIGAIFGICLQAATDVVCDDSSVEAGLVCPSQLIDLNAFVGAQPLMSPGPCTYACIAEKHVLMCLLLACRTR